MSRVAITEFAAKKIVFGDLYTGITATPVTVDEVVASLKEKVAYIVKIDVGIKKRGKQGLLRLNVTKNDVKTALEELFVLGYDRCVIEEMVSHETKDERYISIDLQREGAQILCSEKGGVEIEDNNEEIKRFFVPRADVLNGTTSLSIADVPLSVFLKKMQEFHLSFMEINPYLVKDGSFIVLDMAILIDDTKVRKLPPWIEEHVISKTDSPQEKAVEKQAEVTAAALTLKTLNKNGSILTLLSGGGASLVAMDALEAAGLQEKTINYSEYSGAPTRDETHTYANTLLEVLFASETPKKAILIAGGVANFTDILVTFQGIVDAFTDNVDKLQQQNIYICVRRGGPNQEKGLAHLRNFLSANAIPHDVYGPDLSLGEVGTLLIKHI